MKDRIAAIIKRESLTPSQFAEKTGIQRAALSHILNERNKPSLDVVMKIHQAFSYVNLEWLLYGIGNMLSDTPLEIIGKTEKQPTLFDQIGINSSQVTSNSEYRKEIDVKPIENVSNTPIIQEVKYVERPVRKITEIRIFYDDNTYQIFKPEE